MDKAKVVLGIFLVIFFIGLWCKCSFADDAGNPYSGKPAASIGAWYDETWEASGFYRLQRIGTSNNFRYEYTTDPTTSTNPTFVQEPEEVDKDTDQEQGHQHEYKDATSGASLPQDVVITEWKVTGHVHFSSGL
jgi:hypothetical protein